MESSVIRWSFKVHSDTMYGGNGPTVLVGCKSVLNVLPSITVTRCGGAVRIGASTSVHSLNDCVGIS